MKTRTKLLHATWTMVLLVATVGTIELYWGKTIDEYSRPDVDIAGSIMRNWLEYFRTKGPEILKKHKSDFAPPDLSKPI